MPVFVFVPLVACGVGLIAGSVAAGFGGALLAVAFLALWGVRESGGRR